MNAIELVLRLNQHRTWVNGNLMAAVERLSHEQLHAPFSIGQGSIWRSLVHLYAAEYVWLEALLGNEQAVVQGDLPGKIPGNQLGEGKIADCAELRKRWEELERRWGEYLHTLQPSDLDNMVYRVSSSIGAGIRFGTRRADVLLHVCTHAQYTTAQVVNMLRQTGVEKLPDSMLIILARQELG